MASKLSSRKTEVTLEGDPKTPWLWVLLFCTLAGYLLHKHPTQAGVQDLELAVVERQGSETFYRDLSTQETYKVEQEDTPVGSIWGGVRIVNKRVVAKILVKGSRGSICFPVRASDLYVVYHGGKTEAPTGLYNVETCKSLRQTP